MWSKWTLGLAPFVRIHATGSGLPLILLTSMMSLETGFCGRRPPGPCLLREPIPLPCAYFIDRHLSAWRRMRRTAFLYNEPDEIMTSQQRRHVVHTTPIYCVWHSNNATATDAHSECLDTLDIATELDKTINILTDHLPASRTSLH
jgi:hypothetical protein